MENLEIYLNLVVALMEICFHEVDRRFLQENLTLPEAKDVLRAFGLIA